MNNLMLAGNNGNDGNNGNGIDLDKLLLLSSQNTMQIQALNESFKNIHTEIGNIVSSVNNLDSDVQVLNKRMDIIETQEEITTEQAETLSNSVKTRANYLLNYDVDDISKYRGTLISWCYNDCKQYAGMARKYAATRKENYPGLLGYINNWVPIGGMVAFKAKTDKVAEANRKAKEQGYR